LIDRPIWDVVDWDGLSSLDVDIHADVCVIGLGGSGLAAVEEAIGLGKSVVGIDAGHVAGEAAGRNGGFMLAGLALSYHEAIEAWGPSTVGHFYDLTLRELKHILSQPASQQVGSLRIADTDEELADIEEELAALVADGYEAYPYEGTEGKGMFMPSDGVANPMQRCRDLALGLIDEGAQLFEHSRAMSVEPGRVETLGGVIEANSVVVAVDGRLELLFPELEGRVRTARLEMLATTPVPPTYDRPVHTAYGYIYWQQLPDGRLALGGLRDRFAEHSWSMESGPTDDLQNALDGYLSEMGIQARVSHRWAGHAGYTPDRKPIYEEIKPGVWVVGGYCGHGNVTGSVYARAAVRSAVTGEKESLL
jgi:glycine/D-amino acid oxidase-like deaminating enzyme